MTETELNILECFDNNIGNNLDLTKNYIYVLKLVEDRYYVGRTINIFRRIQEHFTGVGSIYTKKYKPLKVIEVEEEITPEDERKMTFKYVEKYGWEKVRGSYWCSLEIKRWPNLKSYEKMKSQRDKKLLEMANLEKNIKNMYVDENKNIIEIGESLSLTPGTIASRLVKLKLIEEKEQAIGYSEYKDSELYKQICTQNQTPPKKENKLLDEQAKQLKDKIHNKILNGKV
jgi:predicted GIY-YIG superfamily endonuclease